LATSFRLFPPCYFTKGFANAIPSQEKGTANRVERDSNWVLDYVCTIFSFNFFHGYARHINIHYQTLCFCCSRRNPSHPIITHNPSTMPKSQNTPPRPHAKSQEYQKPSKKTHDLHSHKNSNRGHHGLALLCHTPLSHLETFGKTLQWGHI
jgi:hypothetical protein